MAKIFFRLADGSVHALSRNVHGASGPLCGTDARVQLSLIAENLMYFSADDGVVVFTKHIVSAQIGGDDLTARVGEIDPNGTCQCCGRIFIESTRCKPRFGVAWIGILEPYGPQGVCPLCFNTFGRLHGHLREWTSDEWRTFTHRLLDEAGDEIRVDAVARVVAGNVDGLESMVARRKEALARLDVKRRVEACKTSVDVAIVASLVELYDDIKPLYEQRIREIEALESAQASAPAMEIEANKLFEQAMEAGRHGEAAAMKEILMEIVAKYPRTTVCTSAQQRLQRL